MSPAPALTNPYMALSKLRFQISKSFLTFLTMFCCFLMALALPLSNFQLGERGDKTKSSNPLLIPAQKPAPPNSENFHNSLRGIPSLVIPFDQPFLAILNKPGIPTPGGNPKGFLALV